MKEGNYCFATRGTEYAKSVDNGGYNLWISDSSGKWCNGNSFYWLRSPGFDQSLASIVYDNGYINTDGLTVDNSIDGVRPALWISY